MCNTLVTKSSEEDLIIMMGERTICALTETFFNDRYCTC